MNKSLKQSLDIKFYIPMNERKARVEDEEELKSNNEKIILNSLLIVRNIKEIKAKWAQILRERHTNTHTQ